MWSHRLGTAVSVQWVGLFGIGICERPKFCLAFRLFWIAYVGHSIKELPRCPTVKMPDPRSDKSRRLEVDSVHSNGRVKAFLSILIVCDATTFLASIIGANLTVP